MGARLLVFLTDVGNTALDYLKPNQVDLSVVTAAEAEEYLAQGHFLAGSMGPNIEAAIRLIEGCQRTAIITAPEEIGLALKGKAGTHILPNTPATVGEKHGNR